jgi:GNAT superfamily N-acetyltransferase
MEIPLEKLLAHEAEYFTFGADWTQTSAAWFLDGPELANYRDCNRALRLRDDGRGADAVAREMVAHYRARGVPVTADIDPVAERQGIGAALRRLGVMPVVGRTLLMRYERPLPPVLPERGIAVEVVPNAVNTTDTIDTHIIDTKPMATREWVETVVSDEDAEDAPFWRAITEREARSPACRLYLARLDGRPAGACDLFVSQEWGRIDSVVTHPDLRRRGVASALVARVVQDSIALGNEITYLFTEAGGMGEPVYTRLGFTTAATDILKRHIRY